MIDHDKLDAACAKMDALSKRMDSSPSMEAFRERQAARKVEAEKGIAEAQLLVGRATKIYKELKKLGAIYTGDPASAALDLAKKASASFGLAINTMSIQNDYESWTTRGKKELVEAKQEIERQESRLSSEKSRLK